MRSSTLSHVTRRVCAATVGATALLVGAAGPATASTVSRAAAPSLVKSDVVAVCESHYDVDALTDLRPGDRLVVQASGTIWAGWWFIGRNGPQGLWFPGGSWDYPAPNEPAAGLLLRAGGGYRFVGAGTSIVSTEPAARLYFRINENVSGNGNGCFAVSYQQYR